MDYSMSGFPVHRQLLELAQTHVHRVGDTIQTPHPLSSPSPLAFNLSQHKGLFQRPSWRAQAKLCAHQDPGERSNDPRTGPDLPVGVQESPAEAWVGSALLQGQGR